MLHEDTCQHVSITTRGQKTRKHITSDRVSNTVDNTWRIQETRQSVLQGLEVTTAKTVVFPDVTTYNMVQIHRRLREVFTVVTNTRKQVSLGSQ